MSHVARATPDDWQAVREVRLAALADAPDAFFSTLEDEERQPEPFWRDRLGDAGAVTFLSFDDDGRPHGTMTVIPHHRDPQDALLVGVWVDPSVRGRGTAMHLLDVCIEEARDAGYARLSLEVGDHNERAIRFYRRAGFEPTGRTSRFPAPRDHLTEHELAVDLR